MAHIGNNLFLPDLHMGKKLPYGEHSRAYFYKNPLGKLPNEVKFCKKCVVSNQRPRIVFNEEDVCGACVWAGEKNNVVDWAQRKSEFYELLDKHRSKDGQFDVIVPCSGGKDSGSVAYKLKYEYGMHPLAVVWSPLLYTEIGFQNLQNMISSGIPCHIFAPDRNIQRIISKLSLVLLGDHFMAFSRGMTSYPLHVALDLGVRLVMGGENGELEYGGSLKNKDIPGQPIGDFVNLYYKGSKTEQIIQFGIENDYLEKDNLDNAALKYYSPPRADILVDAGVEFRWFGYYHKWVPQENFYYATEHYGFRVNPEGHSESTYNKYASLDDHTDPLHYYLSYIKFGIGRATSDAAHEIREGHLTREEGVALVHRYDHILPSKYLSDYLRYLDMTEEEFWEVLDVFREERPNLWEKVNGKWRLKYQVS